MWPKWATKVVIGVVAVVAKHGLKNLAKKLWVVLDEISMLHMWKRYKAHIYKFKIDIVVHKLEKRCVTGVICAYGMF